MTWKTEEHYYSGQGQVLLAKRNIDGTPAGFLPLGNVSSLRIAIATSVIEHKESQTGARGTDKRQTTEVKVNLSMTVDNFIRTNLATALRGGITTESAATVSGQSIVGYLGKIVSLGKIKVAALALTLSATPLVAYTNEATAWDYKANLDAGSVQFNDGSVQNFGTGLGKAVTSVTVGATTTITATHSLAVGNKVFLSGFTGADAALLNGKSFTVLTVSTTVSFTIDINTTAKTITATGTPKFAKDADAITAGYTHAENFLVDSLTLAPEELYMRFEGLNTSEGNDPVVVEVFKFSVDPLKELSLITDTFQQFQLDGSVLADLSRPVGSAYFSVRKTN